MTTKSRIAKLESVKLEGIETNYMYFTQEVRTKSHKYFIDGVEVDKANYDKELADYLRSRKDDGVPTEIIYYLAEGEL